MSDAAAQTRDADGCDIMDPSCRAEVLALVAATRGKPVPPQPQYVFQPLRASGESAPIIFSQKHDEEQWDAAYTALQLLPAVHSSQFATAHQRDSQLDMAFYSPSTKSVVLPAAPDVLPRDARSEMGVLAHELTHYMQDLEMVFERFSKTAPDDADAQSSLRAFTEGEASYVGWSIESRLGGITSTLADWTAYFERLDGSYLARVSNSRTPLATALDVMPYSIGGRRIAELWLSSGRAAVDTLSEHIPVSFAQWMRRDAAMSTPPSRDVPCAAPIAPKGYTLVDQTHLGALGALAFLASGQAEDLEVVAQLRADTLFLYAPLTGDGSANGAARAYTNQQPNVVAAWLLQFETEAAARAFERAIPPPSFGDRTFTSKKATVALAVSTDPAQPAAAPLEMLDCQTQ